MADNDRVDLKKFASSFFQAIPWMKNIRYFIGFVLILLVIYTIYRAWFYKPEGNVSKPTHNPSVIMLPKSGNIGTLDQSQDVKTQQTVEQNKHKWWQPIPYVAVYGEVRSKNEMINDFETGYGAQVGLRWDF